MNIYDRIRLKFGVPLVHLEWKEGVTSFHLVRRRRFSRDGRPYCLGPRSQTVFWLDELPAGVLATSLSFIGPAYAHKYYKEMQALNQLLSEEK